MLQLTMRSVKVAMLGLAVLALAFGPGPAHAADPRGIYVVNNYSNNVNASGTYPPGLIRGYPTLAASPHSAPAYVHDVDGHAIFVPLAKMLPASIPAGLNGMSWAQLFNAQNAPAMFDWTYLDTLIALAVSHHKKFTIAMVVGLETTTANWQTSLPTWFEPTCNPGFDPSHPNTPTSCAPTFNFWKLGGATPACIAPRYRCRGMAMCSCSGGRRPSS